MKSMFNRVSLIVAGAIFAHSALATMVRSEMPTSNEPRSVLQEIQDKLNNSKALSVTSQEEKNGVRVETKCIVKQFGKGRISFRQEQQVLLPNGLSQSLVTIMDNNKLYIFPIGCGNVVVRMKYFEARETDSPLANLFFSRGTVERVSDCNADCLIRYICTPAEVSALNWQEDGR